MTDDSDSREHRANEEARHGNRGALEQAHKAGWDAAIEAAASECEDWQAFTRYAKERISGEMADSIRALPYKPQEDVSDG